MMNARQINKSRMYGATVLVLDNNSHFFEGLPELVAAHQQLKEKMAAIDSQRQVQVVDNKGLTKNKTLLREELTTLLLRTVSALTAVAAATGDVVLKSRVAYHASDLHKRSDRIICDIAVHVSGMAAPVVTDLQKFFVGPEELARLDTLTAALKSAIPLNRVASSTTKVSTGNIQAVSHEIDLLLRTRMDLLLKPFEFTVPDFYHAYRNSRSIVNYGGRGKAVAAPATV